MFKFVRDKNKMPQEMLLAAYSVTKRAPRLFAFGSNNLTTTVKTVRADVMTQMHFASGRFHGQRRVGQEIMRTMHTALGRGFFVLLNSHFTTPIKLMLPF